MTTVTGKLIDAATPQRVEMRATLVDVTGKDAVGYVASVPGELVKPVPITAESDGDWTVTLTANSLIQSDVGDTLWAIQEGRTKDGTPINTYVVVPATGGPYWAGEIRADLSDTVTGGGTVVYLTGPQGATGPTGPAGSAGADGQDGASAYQVAVAAGFAGTEAQWLASLVGPQGEPGPQGPAGADGSTAEAQAYTDTAISTHAADTTSVHGIADTAALETATGAQAKADTAQTAATTAAATDATSKVTAHTGATDPHGDRAWADSKFATSAALGTLNTTVTDLDGFVSDCLTRVSAIENGTAWLSGLNVAGNAVVSNGDLTVSDVTKGYRFRRGGSALDLEATGADLLVSNWSGTGFNGTQRAYLRLSADAQNVQVAGPVESVAGLYGAAVHKLDPVTGVASLGGKNGLTAVRFAGLKATPGAPTTGAWTAGDAITDSAGAWWLCTASGTPGTWTTGALPTTGGTISGNLAVTGHALGQDTPAAHGIAAWCYDPALAVNSTTLTNGTLYLTRVNIPADVTVTKLYWWVGNSGSSPATNQNHAGLYASDGTLLASANVDAAVSSTGLKTTTISSQALSAGSFYWIALLFNASVPPTLTRASGWTGVDAAANVGQTAATYQYAKNGTGRTALPASITPASNVGTDFAGPWVAVGA